jgi:hypothetical protein
MCNLLLNGANNKKENDNPKWVVFRRLNPFGEDFCRAVCQIINSITRATGSITADVEASNLIVIVHANQTLNWLILWTLALLENVTVA